MAFQPWQGGQPAQPMNQSPMMRVSHAERERAVDVLKACFAEGRLPQPEYEERVTRAYQAQTYGELQVLVGDLPQGPLAQPQFVPWPVAPMVPQTFLPARTNGSATGALVCGILGTMVGVTAIPAVILGTRRGVRSVARGSRATAWRSPAWCSATWCSASGRCWSSSSAWWRRASDPLRAHGPDLGERRRVRRLPERHRERRGARGCGGAVGVRRLRRASATGAGALR